MKSCIWDNFFWSLSDHHVLNRPSWLPTDSKDSAYIDGKVSLEKWNGKAQNCGTVSALCEENANKRSAGKRVNVPILNIIGKSCITCINLELKWVKCDKINYIKQTRVSLKNQLEMADVQQNGYKS